MSRSGRALASAVLAIFVTVGVIVTATALWFRNAVYGESGLPLRQTDVVVPRGASFAEVTGILVKHGVIEHPVVFRVLARMRHVDNDVKAGEYRFDRDQSSDDVLRKLVSGEEQVAVWVTIPEGYTAREIAGTLAAHKLGTEPALAATFLHDHIDVDGARTRSLEGYLFPDTYLVPTDVTPGATAKLFTDEFRKQLPPDAGAKAKALGYTLPQVVTIASLVEREAKADDERALMAGVYYNRLKRGMPLEVDATIEYIFPAHHDVITRRDLAIDSPYNTYLHTGLPPTPIANPGKPSLDAAFSPQPSDYLYYVAKGDGHSAFAKTLAEHNANVARYLK